MKKVFALLFVASVFAFASCGEKKQETSADSTKQDSTEVAPPAAPADSVKGGDSTQTAPADSVKK